MSLVIRRAVVDLPQPLSPTRPKVFPSGKVKEISSTAFRVLAPANQRLNNPPVTSKCLVSFFTSRRDMFSQQIDCFFFTTKGLQNSGFTTKAQSSQYFLIKNCFLRALGHLC